jgi:uncharacterized membrane protein
MPRQKESFAAALAAARRAGEKLAPSPDLHRSECLGFAVKVAFPLPTTGAFSDLLAAIDSADGHN